MDKVSCRINVQLEESHLRDFLACSRSQLSGGQRAGFQFFTWVILLTSIPLLPFIFTWREPVVETYGASVLLLLIGVTVFAHFVTRQRKTFESWMESPEARMHLQPREVEVTPRWLITRTALTEHKYAWALVAAVERHLDQTYLLISQGHIIVIPDSTFREKAAREAFVLAVNECKDRSAGGAMSCPQCSYDLRGDAANGCPECGWGRGTIS